MTTKRAWKLKAKKAARPRKNQTVGESIIEGLQQAIRMDARRESE